MTCKREHTLLKHVALKQQCTSRTFTVHIDTLLFQKKSHSSNVEPLLPLGLECVAICRRKGRTGHFHGNTMCAPVAPGNADRILPSSESSNSSCQSRRSSCPQQFVLKTDINNKLIIIVPVCVLYS